MEEGQYTSLTAPTDYFQQWYQSSQQHPEAQHGLPYHNMGHYTEGPRDELVMTELSVHREPPQNSYQEPIYQNYQPTASNHCQVSAYLQNDWELHQQEELQQHQQYPAQQQLQKHQQQPYHTPHQQELQQQHRQQYPVQQQQQQQQQQHHHPQHQNRSQQQEPNVHHQPQPAAASQAEMPVKKKRGRPPKQQSEGGKIKEEDDEAEAAKKAKRALNRFNGMSVAEVMSKTLPDVITYNLDILIIGINPGLLSAYKGHHYPNPGNHFWKCLFLSGFTEKQLSYMHDQSLPEMYGIGFTNMVERTTPGSKDLSSKEIREGGKQLLDKLQKYRPLIAAFNGKGIYEIFCKETFGVKAKNLEFGLQPYKIPETETVCFLMPSSSPRCAQFPRAQDKVHFYIKLKELRDQMKGFTPNVEVKETQYSFDLQLAKEDAKRMAIKEEQLDPEYENCGHLQEDLSQSSSSFS